MDSRAAARSFSDVSALVKHAPLPIYGYCRLHGGRLLASNGVTDIDLPFGESDGNVLVPAQEMATLYKTLIRAGEAVRWECDGDRVHVSHTYGDVWLQGLPADRYPAATDLEVLPDPLAEYDVKAFLSALRLADRILGTRTGLHCDPNFEGAFLEVYEDGFSLVAMGGPSLVAYRHQEGDQPVWSGILPRATVGFLVKRLSASLPDADKVVFSGSSVGARFSFADEHISTRLIEGTYPDWRKILAVRNELPANVAVDPFIQVLELCAIGSALLHLIPVHLSFSRRRLDISTEHEYGSTQQSLPTEYQGGRLTLLVNGKLLLDLAKALSEATEGEAIRILHDGSPHRALRLISEDEKALCVLMPLRDAGESPSKEEESS